MNNKQLQALILDKIAKKHYKNIDKWTELKATFGYDRTKKIIEDVVETTIKEINKQEKIRQLQKKYNQLKQKRHYARI